LWWGDNEWDFHFNGVEEEKHEVEGGKHEAEGDCIRKKFFLSVSSPSPLSAACFNKPSELPSQGKSILSAHQKLIISSLLYDFPSCSSVATGGKEKRGEEEGNKIGENLEMSDGEEVFYDAPRGENR
jgi:hypothetical protein